MKQDGEAVGKEGEDRREKMGLAESWFKDILQAGRFSGR